jgi:hypothetical protein
MHKSSRKHRTTKRYVLFMAEGDLSDGEVKELAGIIERRHPGSKLIQLKGNPRAVIVKTTNESAPGFRDPGSGFGVAGKALRPVLTSGAIGNLKRRASEASTNGQVS